MAFHFEVYLFLCATSFLVIYLYFTRNNNHWKKKNVPYLKPLPFFGNIVEAIMMYGSVGEIFQKMYHKRETPVLGIFILDKPCLLIRDPQLVTRILVNDFQYFCDRTVLSNKRDDPISAYTLFVVNNPEWKEIRSKVTPFFTSRNMKAMSALIEKVSDEMVVYLKDKIESNPVIDMKKVAVRFTVDVITSTAFGVEANSFKNENSRFYVEAERMFDWNDFVHAFRMRCYFLAHTLVKLFRMKFLHPISTKFLVESFLNILELRARSRNICRNDLVDIVLRLVENDEFFMDKEKLASQAIQFFAAGFETSSTTIGFGFFELAQHPKIQKKLRDEIMEVSEKHGGINYDSLKEMDYLDMCIKEILRKYPVLPLLERKCNSNYTIPETGTVIDKGTAVYISAAALHYDPQYFPNPEVFDPERFSQKNKHKIVKCTYLPFGEGPRNCIGGRFGLLTVKYSLAHILKNFSVERCAETPKKIRFNPNCFMLSALGGIRLKLEKK